jgi:hypothetical protein
MFRRHMRLGIIGLLQSGKTTIFNALTCGNQPTSMGSGRFEVHTSVVDVPDPRVDRLSEMFRPKKTTYAGAADAVVLRETNLGQCSVTRRMGGATVVVSQLTEVIQQKKGDHRLKYLVGFLGEPVLRFLRKQAVVCSFR